MDRDEHKRWQHPHRSLKEYDHTYNGSVFAVMNAKKKNSHHDARREAAKKQKKVTKEEKKREKKDAKVKIAEEAKVKVTEVKQSAGNGVKVKLAPAKSA